MVYVDPAAAAAAVNFVGVGRGISEIIYSYDGVDWIKTAPVFDTAQTPNRVVFSAKDQLFAAVAASGGSNGPRLVTSPDGIVWTERATGFFDNAADVIVTDDLGWFCAGDKGVPVLARSLDGFNWTLIDVSTLNNLASFSSIAYSGGRLIVSSGNGYAYSDNVGATWIRATGDQPGPGASSSSLIFVNSSYILSTTASTFPNLDSFDDGMTYNNSLTPTNLILCRIVVETIACGGRVNTAPSGFLFTSNDGARTFKNESAMVNHLSIEVNGMTYSPILGLYAVAGFGGTHFVSGPSLSGPFTDAVLTGTAFSYGRDVAARLPPYLPSDLGAVLSLVVPEALIPAGAVVNVTGSLTVTSTFVLSGSLSLESSSVVKAGNLTISGGSLFVQAGASLQVDGKTLISNKTDLIVSASSSQTVVILQSGSLNGTFQTIQAVSSCGTAASIQSVSYAEASLSVEVNVVPCQQDGLSGGAIAGIVVGVIIGGAALAVAIAMVTKYLISQRTNAANAALRAGAAQEMRAHQFSVVSV